MKFPPYRKDNGKVEILIRTLSLILHPLSLSYSAKSFFNLAMTSGGWAITSFASAASCSPPTGSTGHLRFFASANSSGSFSVLIQASRRILSRSGAIPGGAVHGRPNSLGAMTSVARRRSASLRFVAVHQVVERRRFRQQRISFASGLHERTGKAFFEPTDVRLAAKKSRDGDQPALQLAAFERHVDVRRALITSDDVKFYARKFPR